MSGAMIGMAAIVHPQRLIQQGLHLVNVAYIVVEAGGHAPIFAACLVGII